MPPSGEGSPRREKLRFSREGNSSSDPLACSKTPTVKPRATTLADLRGAAASERDKFRALRGAQSEDLANLGPFDHGVLLPLEECPAATRRQRRVNAR